MEQPYDIVELLYGTQTYFRNCAGYCGFHHKYLTVKQIKRKGCLGKQCKSLKKLDHHYWELREIIKQKKESNTK